MNKNSFYDASARKRAKLICDNGSFKELCGPDSGFISPHLDLLNEAVSFDDGVVTGVGKINGRTAFIISQEGKFIGGSVGEIGGAKIVGVFRLAHKVYEENIIKYPDNLKKHPVIIFSFDTGGVRLHESNAGLLAHAEIMEQIALLMGKVPVISLVGSKVGCFGGMGFVCVSTDCLIMSEKGRLGLTGPEVIEEVMGQREFDSADKALIYRTTGGKHKYIMGDAAYIVEDYIEDFKACIENIINKPYAEISKHRLIGTKELLNKQMDLVKLAVKLNPKDSMDVWEYFGNTEPDKIPDMEIPHFIETVRRRG